MKIFSIYDTKAEAYLQPFFLKTTAIAIREIETAVNNPEHQFGKYPQDYVLFELGTWDEEKGQCEMLSAPLSLGVTLEFKSQPEMPFAGVPLVQEENENANNNH